MLAVCSVKKMFDILESNLLGLSYIHFIVMKSVLVDLNFIDSYAKTRFTFTSMQCDAQM